MDKDQRLHYQDPTNNFSRKTECGLGLISRQFCQTLTKYDCQACEKSLNARVVLEEEK